MPQSEKAHILESDIESNSNEDSWDSDYSINNSDN